MSLETRIETNAITRGKDPLDGRSAAEIGRQLATDGGGSVALTEMLLDAIAEQASPVFLSVTGSRALAEAEAADARLAAGHPLSPLDGVPFAWKDLVDMAGERTTAASNIYRHAPSASQDAPVVTNATRAGLVTLGKLNLAEFAYSALGQNPHFGTPLNPRATTPTAPGGSSSGSGVAVAAGLVPASLGSDTGGSVRIPASYCGVVGFKTSERHIPTEGVFALSRTQDTLGPLARSVEDCALLYHILCGAPAPSPKALRHVSIVVPNGIVFDDLDCAVATNFEATLSRLSAAGVHIRDVSITALERAGELMGEIGTIIAADAFFEHRALLDGPDAEQIDHRVRARIEIGRTMTAHQLVTLQRQRAKGMAEVTAALDGAFLVMPTTAGTAPPLAAFETDDHAFARLNYRANRNTNIGSFYNMPGLAIPNGTDSAGLPTSFLLSAPADQDTRLLRAGLATEASIRQ